MGGGRSRDARNLRRKTKEKALSVLKTSSTVYGGTSACTFLCDFHFEVKQEPFEYPRRYGYGAAFIFELVGTKIGKHRSIEQRFHVVRVRMLPYFDIKTAENRTQ